jgi:galactokinase
MVALQIELAYQIFTFLSAGRTMGQFIRQIERFLKSTGRANHAIFFDCRTEEVRTIPFPPGLGLVNCRLGFGKLMNASHESSRRNFKNSTRELDLLVSIAQQLPGVLGARLTGGGFGGAVVVLCEQSRAPAIATEVSHRYLAATGIRRQPSSGESQMKQHDFFARWFGNHVGINYVCGKRDSLVYKTLIPIT